MAESSFYKQNTMPDLISGEAEPQLPSQIGPYQIESLFSKGGMSLLYLGFHPEQKLSLIVKVLSPSYINCPQAVEQFLKEAKVIALTNHPNIVKLYGQGEWEKGLYIAMELIHGVSLKQFIIQQSLSLKRALEIILQVAYALHHLHSHGVIHRDLKPENILITEEGEIKVIDFGIAQLHEEKQETVPAAAFVGTPSYMSPEQKENSASVSFASDIYSLGVILYELVLGKLSYGLISLSGLPKRLKTILARALAVSVSERYQNITDFIHDISHYLQSGSLAKEKPGSDLIKELQEEMQQVSIALSPAQVPEWPQIDVGIAKGRGSQQIGLYYDFFHFPNNSFLLILAATITSRISSCVSVATLRGMLHSYLYTRLLKSPPPETLVPLISSLNEILCLEPLSEPVALGCLLLNPLKDSMVYLSCGLPDLLHVLQGHTTVRTLSSQNILLGTAKITEFSETTDNWNNGDLLVFHTLSLPSTEAPLQQGSLQKALQQAIQENVLLSAQRQAEAIFKGATLSPAYGAVSSPKALFSIQRVS